MAKDWKHHINLAASPTSKNPFIELLKCSPQNKVGHGPSKGRIDENMESQATRPLRTHHPAAALLWRFQGALPIWDAPLGASLGTSAHQRELPASDVKKERKPSCNTLWDNAQSAGRRKAVGPNVPVPAKLEVVRQRPNRSGAGQATGRHP